MDFPIMHHALERLDAVLAAAHEALREDTELTNARKAYTEAYAEAHSAQGHPTQSRVTAERLTQARATLEQLERGQAKHRADVRARLQLAQETLDTAQRALLKAEREAEERETAVAAARDLLQAEHDAAAAKAAALRHLLQTLGEGL
jgi:hypothetical protein